MEIEKLASIFESVRSAALRPEDVLVFKTAGDVNLCMEQKLQIMEEIEKQTGHARILILDGGADIALIHPEPTEQIVVVEAPSDPRSKHRPIATGGGERRPGG